MSAPDVSNLPITIVYVTFVLGLLFLPQSPQKAALPLGALGLTAAAFGAAMIAPPSAMWRFFESPLADYMAMIPFSVMLLVAVIMLFVILSRIDHTAPSEIAGT